MLFEVSKNSEVTELSVIRGGKDPEQPPICADCSLCGTSGNVLSFCDDKAM